MNSTSEELDKLVLTLERAKYAGAKLNFDDLDHLVTLTAYANDECDPGMGLELGLNLMAKTKTNAINSDVRHRKAVHSRRQGRHQPSRQPPSHMPMFRWCVLACSLSDLPPSFARLLADRSFALLRRHRAAHATPREAPATAEERRVRSNATVTKRRTKTYTESVLSLPAADRESLCRCLRSGGSHAEA